MPLYSGSFILDNAGDCGGFKLVPGVRGISGSRNYTFVNEGNGGFRYRFKDLDKERFDALVKDIYGWRLPRPKSIYLEVDLFDPTPLQAMIEGLETSLADAKSTIEELKAQIPPEHPFPLKKPEKIEGSEADIGPVHDPLAKSSAFGGPPLKGSDMAVIFDSRTPQQKRKDTMAKKAALKKQKDSQEATVNT